MILLDPDLEPDPAPKTTSVKRVGALAQKRNSTRNSKTTEPDSRLPSVRGLARFLAAAQAAVRLKGQVTVLLTTDAAIARLNGEFRGKKKATDVLSFPAAGVGAAGMAGDLAVSVETARRQAAEQGHSLAVEIRVLVLHGLLHLAGFDHEVDDGRMARREKVLRARLGLPLGLIERAQSLTIVSGKTKAGPFRQAQGRLSTSLRSAQDDKSVGARELGSGSAARGAETRPSGAKARARAGRVDVRAEARTLHDEAHIARMTADYAGAKARSLSGLGSARLKSCPVTRQIRGASLKEALKGAGEKRPSGAKAHDLSEPYLARLKSCPDTKPTVEIKMKKVSRELGEGHTSGAKAHARSADSIVGVKTSTYQTPSAAKAGRA
jgi:probable rRNA maturation factor